MRIVFHTFRIGVRMFSKIIKLLFTSLLIVFSFSSLYSNDQVVYLRDGKTLTGEIISQTATKILLKLPDGTTKEIQKQDIRRVAFKGAKPVEVKDNTPIVPVPDPAIEAQKKEEDAKKQTILDEKAEKRKKEIEEAKRNRLEIFIGSGSGNLNFQSPNFYQETISVGSALGNTNGEFQFPMAPKSTAGKANLVEIRYSWNRFVGQVGGSSIQSSSNYTAIGTDNITGTAFPKLITGPYQNSMKHAYGNISYSVYPNPKYDIRPMIGVHRFWLKTEDANPIALGAGTAPTFTDQYTGLTPFSVSESLRGFSYGIQYDIKLGERFEFRSSLEIIRLKGTGSFHQDTFLYIPGLADSHEDSFGIYNKWAAKGTILDLKFIYKWKYGVNFWLGINAMSWQYTVSEANLSFQSGNPQSPDDLLLGRLLLGSIGPSFIKETSASAILLGVSYAYDFSR